MSPAEMTNPSTHWNDYCITKQVRGHMKDNNVCGYTQYSDVTYKTMWEMVSDLGLTREREKRESMM